MTRTHEKLSLNRENAWHHSHSTNYYATCIDDRQLITSCFDNI